MFWTVSFILIGQVVYQELIKVFLQNQKRGRKHNEDDGKSPAGGTNVPVTHPSHEAYPMTQRWKTTGLCGKTVPLHWIIIKFWRLWVFNSKPNSLSDPPPKWSQPMGQL